jgi:integrase
MKRTPRTPSYRHHKGSDQGFVELDGRRIYLGKWGLPETEERYHRSISEWLANGRRLRVDPHEITVAELAAAYAKPVKPVLEAHINAVRPFVSRQVGAMIDLQLLTAARPGELCVLRPIDFDRRGKVWLAKVQEHKNQWRGQDRILYVGPKAQEIIRQFLDRPLHTYSSMDPSNR